MIVLGPTEATIDTSNNHLPDFQIVEIPDHGTIERRNIADVYYSCLGGLEKVYQPNASDLLTWYCLQRIASMAPLAESVVYVCSAEPVDCEGIPNMTCEGLFLANPICQQTVLVSNMRAPLIAGIMQEAKRMALQRIKN